MWFFNPARSDYPGNPFLLSEKTGIGFLQLVLYLQMPHAFFSSWQPVVVNRISLVLLPVLKLVVLQQLISSAIMLVYVLQLNL
jgi:hypothetical protein